MTDFKAIRARAARRKGGEAALASLLPAVPPQAALADISDDRILSEMAKRIFSAGFVWSVIEKKWPGFEAAFLGFVPQALVFQPDEFWHDLARDSRIVRNPQKIRSVRDNAAFVADVAKEHGSFGRFLSQWPADDQIGLLDLLGKRGSRLGGKTGQYFLRFVGYDGFVTSNDMVAAMRDAGLDVAAEPTSKADMRKVQAQMNAWAQETGLPRVYISRILAMSVGENHAVEKLQGFMDDA
ncbi:DNA-3-methyladenine glycosylase I [Phreatobacter sp.]|uniref:DNA-3-methyladenine glycosylase I n=1 Tax=Phreatobacter sp. TaxID=1966341 RepID=UPI003F6F4D98